MLNLPFWMKSTVEDLPSTILSGSTCRGINMFHSKKEPIKKHFRSTNKGDLPICAAVHVLMPQALAARHQKAKKHGCPGDFTGPAVPAATRRVRRHIVSYVRRTNMSMDIAMEIVPLTAESIGATVAGCVGIAQADRRGPWRMNKGRRRLARWELDGVVEFHDSLEPEFGTLGNIGVGGLCMKCDRSIDRGVRLELSVHTEKLTLVGRGTVLGSHEMDDDEWFVRIEFDL